MKLVTVKRVMDDAQLSRAAAYALMHELHAVKIGRSVRLPEDRWLRYLRMLCREYTFAGASSGLTATTSTPTAASEFAKNEAQAYATTAQHKAGVPPSESPATSKHHLRLAKVVERAARPSPAPTRASLTQRR